MLRYARNDEIGYTLMEVTMAILLASILSYVSLNYISANPDASRFEQTKSQMNAIRTAILGDDKQIDNAGHRTNFGFIGDLGRLPNTLSDLTTQGNQPAWAFNSTYGIGSGWRGPYLSNAISNDIAFDHDAWGRVYSYNTTANTLTSFGADGVAGGTLYNEDLVVSFPTSLTFSTVSGQLTDVDRALAGWTVQIVYPDPVTSLLGSHNATSASNGGYSFTSVPFGVRALRTSATTVTSYRPIVVDTQNYSVPTSTLNLEGTSESVTYNGTVFDTGGTKVFAGLTSTYSTTVQLISITSTVTGFAGNMSAVILDGRSYTFSPTIANGAAGAVSKSDLIIPANTSTNQIVITYSASVSGKSTTLVLQWAGRSKTDSVTFTPP